MELKKQWNDGGNLSVTYGGDGDGSAVFSSDSYEGIDREMTVAFKGGGVSVERTVRQEGLRQAFGLSGGGVFLLTSGGRYGVLKQGGVTPDEPTMETYTRLTYIECNGQQYINTGYVVQENDIIEMYYITDKQGESDKALFGVVESGIGIWATIYNNNSYVRFGGSASTTVSNARQRYKITLSKGSAAFDDIKGSPAYAEMPTLPLYLFASNNNDRGVNMYGYCQSSGFKISKADGTTVMDLKPCKRDSDSKVGMFDIVNGRFFVNEGSGEDFLAGNEVRITEDYELIDAVAFNSDKAFDTGFYGNEKTSIDVLFQRTDTSGSDYLYGCSSGNRLTAYLTASGTGYWRYGDAYKTLNASTKKIYLAKVTPSSIYIDITGGTISPTAYTTSWTLPLGGSKGSTNTISKSYQGLVYFFRMKHGDELLLDWFPCRRKSDGEEGFWDCVTQTFIEKA